MPSVSIIIPCYNRAGILPGAIESALAQGPDVEVIVVDDGSIDGTADVAANYGAVQVIRTPNYGPSAARNTGIAHACGVFVRFLDSDDRLITGSTSILLAAARNLGVHQIAFGDAISAGGMGMPSDTYGFFDCGGVVMPRAAIFGRVMNAVLPIYRTSDLKEIGGFDARLRISEDYELACRMIAKGFTFHHVAAATYEVGHHLGERLSRHYGKAGYDGQLIALQQIRQSLIAADSPLDIHEWSAFAMMAWRLGRAASRDGFRDEATALFDFASSVSSRAAVSVPWPLRLSYHFMPPYLAERLFENAKAVAGKRH